MDRAAIYAVFFRGETNKSRVAAWAHDSGFRFRGVTPRSTRGYSPCADPRQPGHSCQAAAAPRLCGVNRQFTSIGWFNLHWHFSVRRRQWSADRVIGARRGKNTNRHDFTLTEIGRIVEWNPEISRDVAQPRPQGGAETGEATASRRFGNPLTKVPAQRDSVQWVEKGCSRKAVLGGRAAQFGVMLDAPSTSVQRNAAVRPSGCPTIHWIMRGLANESSLCGQGWPLHDPTRGPRPGGG